MDNRINEIRKLIRALRLSMLEAEAIMREQVNQDLECSFVAGEILKMRTVMSVLVRERERLGDREPILVKSFSFPGASRLLHGLSLPVRQSTTWSLRCSVSNELEILRLRAQLVEVVRPCVSSQG